MSLSLQEAMFLMQKSSEILGVMANLQEREKCLGEGLDGGYKRQLSVKILAICQLSVKFKAICQLSVNWLLTGADE